MGGLVLLAVFLKFNTFYIDFGRIDPTGEADIATDLWYDNVSADVNDGGVTVSIGDEETLSKDSGIYMDENLNLMIPVDEVQEVFACSAHVYDNDTVLLLKREEQLEAVLGDATANLNGEDYDLGSAPVEIDEEYYVPVATVAEAMGYSYYWNAGENRIELANLYAEESIVPSSFSLAAYGRTSAVKNQGQYGTCWAFAALSSLESSLLPERVYIFSPDHMTIQSNFSIQQESGGAYTMAMAYLAAWQGPVLEEEDPYGDGVSPEGLEAAVHVQEMQLIPDKNIEAIKQAVFLYGGVQCSFYNDLNNAFSDSEYYNRDTTAYCYTGSAEANHQVVIVGWDDDYPAENFSVEVEGDGAFLCLNSWGAHFGDDGYFYVSYYDSYIGTNNVAFTRVDDTDNYDHIYQADLCGWVGQIGYGEDTVYAANIYTAESDEAIAAVGFYATGAGTEYKIYTVTDYEEVSDLGNRTLAASGTLEYAGYYTVDLEREIEVAAGEDFAVLLCITVPGASYPMAVEYRANDLTRSVTLLDGCGYISEDGFQWEDTENTYACNLCLKAYTRDQSQ